MKPQNQVTVKSTETDDVFRCNRTFAERHDTLTILDDEPVTKPPRKRKGTRSKPAKSAGPIAAPVADDN